MEIELDDLREGLVRLENLERELDRHVEELARLIDAPGPLHGAQISHASALMGGRSRQLTPALGELDRMLVGFRTAFEAEPVEDPATRRILPRDYYNLAQRIGRFRQVLNQWPQLLNEIKLRAEQAPQPLFPDWTEAQKTRAVASDAMFNLLHSAVNRQGQDEAMQQLGAHADIPLPMEGFLTQMQAARRICLAKGVNLPLRFLDVGCGAGFKVLAARQILEWGDGLELDPGYLALARGLLDRPACGAGDVIEADALKFERYDRYDVIYMYQPIRDTDLMADLERRIVDTALPGTVLVAPYQGFAGSYRFLGCGHAGYGVYLVGMDDAIATEIAESAELIGTAARRVKKLPLTHWEPVLAALSRRGVQVLDF